MTVNWNSAVDILARTMVGEDDVGGADGMQAVASVVMNRVNSGITWWGNTILTVCLKPLQFSCWNSGSANRARILALTNTNPSFVTAQAIAQEAVAGTMQDLVDGATNYLAISALNSAPDWIIGMTVTAIIGEQIFLKN